MGTLNEYGVGEGALLTLTILEAIPPILIAKATFTDDHQGDDWRDVLNQRHNLGRKASFPPGNDYRTIVNPKTLPCTMEKVEIKAALFRDQDWGNKKANIGLELRDSGGKLVTRCNVFGTYRSSDYRYGKSPSRTLGAEADVVRLAEPGFHYVLVYTVGGGGGHRIIVKDITCTAFPTGSSDEGTHDSVKTD